jgi:NAD-dependent dihydropyrimidine dehydrogenase PreA subunit
VGSGQEPGMETSFGVRARPIRWLYLASREVVWRVTRVEPREREDEPTFCAVVPGKHEFTLAGGIYTHNCGACEPECPVEAIFPEDALPEKWEPFVRINAAFNEGLDVASKLAQEYAVEHDVHNVPLDER